MSRFDAIRTERSASPSGAETPATAAPGKASARAGKKMVGGYFSQEFSRGLNMLALEQNLSLQALLGEAVDDLMRKYGRHPFGER